MILNYLTVCLKVLTREPCFHSPWWSFYLDIIYYQYFRLNSQGPCLEEGQVCQQLCQRKRETCEHVCGAVCHGETPCPNTPCKAKVSVSCGNIESKICDDINSQTCAVGRPWMKVILWNKSRCFRNWWWFIRTNHPQSIGHLWKMVSFGQSLDWPCETVLYMVNVRWYLVKKKTTERGSAYWTGNPETLVQFLAAPWYLVHRTARSLIHILEI